MPDEDTALGRLTESAKAWIDLQRIHDALGKEGQSSDESDNGGQEDPVYEVRVMEWRAEEVVQRYARANPRKHILNLHGKRKAGTLPRNRVRVRNASASVRAPPTGKPINLYNPEWYGKLSARQKLSLNAAPPIKYLTSADADS